MTRNTDSRVVLLCVLAAALGVLSPVVMAGDAIPCEHCNAAEAQKTDNTGHPASGLHHPDRHEEFMERVESDPAVKSLQEKNDAQEWKNSKWEAMSDAYSEVTSGPSASDNLAKAVGLGEVSEERERQSEEIEKVRTYNEDKVNQASNIKSKEIFDDMGVMDGVGESQVRGNETVFQPENSGDGDQQSVRIKNPIMSSVPEMSADSSMVSSNQGANNDPFADDHTEEQTTNSGKRNQMRSHFQQQRSTMSERREAAQTASRSRAGSSSSADNDFVDLMNGMAAGMATSNAGKVVNHSQRSGVPKTSTQPSESAVCRRVEVRCETACATPGCVNDQHCYECR